MSTPSFSLFLAGLEFAAMLFVAAIPWIWAFDPVGFRRWLRDRTVLAGTLGGVLATGVIFSILMKQGGDVATLAEWGRTYGRILHVLLRSEGRRGGKGWI